MRIPKFNSLNSPRGDFLWGDFFKLAKTTLHGKKYYTKKKNFTESSYKSRKQQKYFTRDLRFSTSSFINKSLVTLDWSPKSKKHFHHRLPKLWSRWNIFIIIFQIVIKVKELKGYILLQKNITTKIIPHNVLILIKICFVLFFSIVLFTLQDFTKFVHIMR